MSLDPIAQRVAEIRASLPEGVLLVAAAKTRSADEVRRAVDAGVAAVGHNYVQEAEAMAAALDRRVSWHLIGHLQRNKAKRAAALFDMIETIDSARIAKAVNRHAKDLGKVTPVLIEVNIGEEPRKSGVLPDQLEALARKIAGLENVRLQGLMTMAPYSPDPEDSRPCFRRTKALFDRLGSLGLAGVQMRYLSMGMSNTYRVAVEEGANIVRVGTALFGQR